MKLPYSGAEDELQGLSWEEWKRREEMKKRVRKAVNRAIRCIPKETLKRVKAAFREGS